MPLVRYSSKIEPAAAKETNVHTAKLIAHICRQFFRIIVITLLFSSPGSCGVLDPAAKKAYPTVTSISRGRTKEFRTESFNHTLQLSPSLPRTGILGIHPSPPLFCTIVETEQSAGEMSEAHNGSNRANRRISGGEARCQSWAAASSVLETKPASGSPVCSGRPFCGTLVFRSWIHSQTVKPSSSREQRASP